MNEKILIENGTIIDGTGSKEYVDTILMEKGVISAIGKDAKKIFR
jgi:N-acyl-D-aspartate/D-glutamate deacylase